MTGTANSDPRADAQWAAAAEKIEEFDGPPARDEVHHEFLSAQSRAITKASGSNFVLSFLLLGGERRRGMEVLYAFCRAVDDAVDEAPNTATAAAGIAFWRAELDRIERGVPAESPLGAELAVAVERFGLRIDRLRAIVDGCAMDIDPQGFETAEDLDHYCWHVASAVGLCCLPIFGACDPEVGEVAQGSEPELTDRTKAAESYAEELGLALQWTNILRDLRSDAEEGRIYVPRQWLREHGVEPSWLDGSGPAEAYADGGPVHALVEAIAARALRRFAAARAVKPRGFSRALLPAEVMASVYRDLLMRARARGGRIDGPRPRVPKWTRIRCLLGAFARSHFPFG
jgi:phytoene synthase